MKTRPSTIKTLLAMHRAAPVQARVYIRAGRPVALHVVVPGPVVAYQRVMQGKAAGVKPRESRRWTERVTQVVALAWRHADKIDRPCVLHTYGIDERPAYMLKKDPTEYLWRPVKPDGDNVRKLAQDAIMDAGVLADDGRVVRGEPFSLWAPVGMGPRIEAWLLAPDGMENPVLPELSPGAHHPMVEQHGYTEIRRVPESAQGTLS